MKPLTMEELKNMDGNVVFTIPLVPDKPCFDRRFLGLGFHLVDISKKLLFKKGEFLNERWKLESLNKIPFGFIAFKNQVTEEQALQAWKELKSHGMVRYESD